MQKYRSALEKAADPQVRLSNKLSCTHGYKQQPKCLQRTFHRPGKGNGSSRSLSSLKGTIFINKWQRVELRWWSTVKLSYILINDVWCVPVWVSKISTTTSIHMIYTLQIEVSRLLRTALLQTWQWCILCKYLIPSLSEQRPHDLYPLSTIILREDRPSHSSTAPPMLAVMIDPSNERSIPDNYSF